MANKGATEDGQDKADIERHDHEHEAVADGELDDVQDGPLHLDLEAEGLRDEEGRRTALGKGIHVDHAGRALDGHVPLGQVCAPLQLKICSRYLDELKEDGQEEEALEN